MSFFFLPRVFAPCHKEKDFTVVDKRFDALVKKTDSLSSFWWLDDAARARVNIDGGRFYNVEQQREQNRVMSFPSTSREMKLCGDTARWWSRFFFFFFTHPRFYRASIRWRSDRERHRRVRFCASVRISCARSKLSGQSHLVGFYEIMNIAVRMERIFFYSWKIALNLRVNGVTVDSVLVSLSMSNFSSEIILLTNYSFVESVIPR